MSPQQKQNIKTTVSNLHQWMTVLGLPILVALVGDMYVDFKKMRDNDIRQEQRINTVERQVDQHQNILMTYILGKK